MTPASGTKLGPCEILSPLGVILNWTAGLPKK